MAHFLIAIAAATALIIVLALVFVLQSERPRLRRIGAAILCALGAAIVAWLFVR